MRQMLENRPASAMNVDRSCNRMRACPATGRARRAGRLLGALLAMLVVATGPALAKRNNTVLGCWGDADKGDSVDLKLHFVHNGAMVQYDENQAEKNKRSFGAWEMEAGSSFLIVYWPNGRITQYHIKRIGPILHFSGVNGARNFTLRKIGPDNCWEPRT